MTRLTLILAAALLAVGMVAGPALAAAPGDVNCWGVVTSQRATVYGDVGTHSSAQDEPRSGLRNVAVALYEANLISAPTLGALGSGLATLDGLDGTFCPENGF